MYFTNYMYKNQLIKFSRVVWEIVVNTGLFGAHHMHSYLSYLYLSETWSSIILAAGVYLKKWYQTMGNHHLSESLPGIHPLSIPYSSLSTYFSNLHVPLPGGHQNSRYYSSKATIHGYSNGFKKWFYFSKSRKMHYLSNAPCITQVMHS